MECAKCTKQINEESEEFFECDGCWMIQHAKCAGVKKSELTARKNSKSLKLYCEKCYADPGKVMTDHILTILKFVYKIDVATQKQEETNKTLESSMKYISDETSGIKEQLKEMKGHNDNCGEKIRTGILNVAQQQGVSGNRVNNNKPTYASVLTADKSLIVLPKNKDGDSERTK